MNEEKSSFSEEELLGIQEAFRKLYKRQWWYLGAIFVVAGFMLFILVLFNNLGIEFENDAEVLIFLLLLPIVWLSINNWKCPACGVDLGQREIYPKQCKACGVLLR